MESRVVARVELLEKGRLEDGIGAVHGLENVIARGTPEDTDRGNAARDGRLDQFAENTHG